MIQIFRIFIMIFAHSAALSTLRVYLFSQHITYFLAVFALLSSYSSTTTPPPPLQSPNTNLAIFVHWLLTRRPHLPQPHRFVFISPSSAFTHFVFSSVCRSGTRDINLLMFLLDLFIAPERNLQFQHFIIYFYHHFIFLVFSSSSSFIVYTNCVTEQIASTQSKSK